MLTLAKRLDRLEAHIFVTGTVSDKPLWYRRLIYDPQEWDIGEDEAIAKMEAEELDRLVAGGKIRDADRNRVASIIRVIVSPPEYPDCSQRID